MMGMSTSPRHPHTILKGITDVCELCGHISLDACVLDMNKHTCLDTWGDTMRLVLFSTALITDAVISFRVLDQGS